jgi:hypothetical protein
MFVEINTFFNVEIKEKSLIMIDIDDTILKYDQLDKTWWKNTFEYYYSITNNYDESDKKTLDEWRTMIYEKEPIHVDKSGMFDLFKRAEQLNCKIIFLTARCETLKSITVHHLNKLGIFIDEIYFTPNIEKGIILKKLKNEEYADYIYTVAIDDLDSNLKSIQDNFENETTTLYKMKC